MKTKNLRLLSLVAAVTVVALFAFAFSPNKNYSKAETADVIMDCPNGFIVTVNGGTYPFTIIVQGLTGSCQTNGTNSPCCFSMQGQSAGTYTVIADNGSCRVSEKAYWRGSGNIPVTVVAYDCYK